jgi:VanZ family protein
LRASKRQQSLRRWGECVRGAIGAWLRVPAPLRWAAPAVVMAALWWSSSRSPQPQPFDLVRALLHNGMHVVAWSVLAASIWGAMRRRDVANQRAAVAVGLVGAVIYGVVDEIHQSFVDGRVSSISDVLSDTAGALLGVMGCAAAFDRRRFRPMQWTGAAALAVACVVLATFTRW